MPKSKLITCAEFQLFLDENPDYAPDHWEKPRFPKGDGKKPVLGLSPGAARAFCDWLTQREGSDEWIYRLPEKGEADDGECCWQTNGDLVELSHPQPTDMDFLDWMIDSFSAAKNKTNKLLMKRISLTEYNPNMFSSTFAYIIANARAHPTGINMDMYIYINHERTYAKVIVFDGEGYFRYAKVTVSRSASTSQDLAQAIVAAFRRQDGGDSWRHLYPQCEPIIENYFHLINTFDKKYQSVSPLRALQEFSELEAFRDKLLHHVFDRYHRQPRKVLNNDEWETWQHELDELLQAYATLVMYEKRRTGEWQPFEGLRIVKARRKE